jgi:low temperature requirement A protein (LtrA)
MLDLCAAVAGYWLPRRGHAVTTDYDIDGGQVTDRCQGFIIIGLGESIVVTGATAADAGLSATVVFCLCVAFLERLVRLAREVDFAAFVFAEDEWMTKGGRPTPLPDTHSRATTSFEAGQFGGALGIAAR